MKHGVHFQVCGLNAAEIERAAAEEAGRYGCVVTSIHVDGNSIDTTSAAGASMVTGYYTADVYGEVTP